MSLAREDMNHLVEEISRELGARKDGSGNNLIVPRCPFCQKEGGKYGIYIGKDTARKTKFMSHCFSCGRSTYTLNQLLESISRPDLMPVHVSDPGKPVNTSLFLLDTVDEEIDDDLYPIELPDFYRRCYFHPYLQSRGFDYNDFDYFEAGTTKGLNFKFDDYVIFPVTDHGIIAGYVARHTSSKTEIDNHNRKVKLRGGYKILRFRNSTENDFVKLIYNIDSVVEGETEAVVLVEGIFDVVALTRKLDLYDNLHIAVVATFGKKISRTQIYKLQAKGVETIVVGYDGDAVEAIKKVATELTPYFNVLIADIPCPDKDWEDLSNEEIYFIFSYHLRTLIEYKLSKIQELK